MISLVKITVEKIPEVKELLEMTWKETYKNIFPTVLIEEMIQVWHDPQRLADQIADPHTYFVAAYETEKMVGIVTLRELSPESLFMSRLYVLPDKQRRGVGKLLIQNALTHFPNADKVILEVEEHNIGGKVFYEKQGFRQTGKKQIQFTNTLIPVLVMEKNISLS